MRKTIILQGKNIPYRLSKRKGMRYMRLSYSPLRGLWVSAPRWYPFFVIERFLQEKTSWILEQIKQFPFNIMEGTGNQEDTEYRVKKNEALNIVEGVAGKYAKRYGVVFQRIAVRNQRTRWGSCSRLGNLSFHYKTAFITDHLRDYIVVHELCHLKEMNHSVRFWDLVAQTIPNYKEIRRELKKYHLPKNVPM